jgi:hypothetical protein
MLAMPHVDRSSYRLVVAGQYDAAGVEPPVSGPSVYRRIARTVLAEHGIDPLTTEPEELAHAEGFEISYQPTPHRTGIQVGNILIVPWDNDALKRALRIIHERAHAHLRKHGAPHHTEADAIWMTLELAFPTWLRGGDRLPEHVPSWVVALVNRRKAA